MSYPGPYVNQKKILTIKCYSLRCGTQVFDVINTSTYTELSLAAELPSSAASSFDCVTQLSLAFNCFHGDQTRSFVLAAWLRENDVYVLPCHDTD